MTCCIKRNRFDAECGVVMMETVITLPIYLLLLAGLIWSAEIGSTRIKLMIADFGNVWAHGVRYGGADVAQIGGKLYGDQLTARYEPASFSGVRSTGSNTAWWSEAQSRSVLSITQPDWVNAIARLPNLIWGTSNSGMAAEATLTMNSRFEPENANKTQILYTRRETNQWRRDRQYGERLCGNPIVWADVNNEYFPGTDSSSDSTGGSILNTYIRDNNGERYSSFY